jgi:hypothetical protein
LLISALLKATFSSYSAKSFSKALSREHDSTENEIKGLNVCALALFGCAKVRRSKNNEGRKNATSFLSFCISAILFSRENLISKTVRNRPLKYDKKMRRLSFRQKNDFQEWKTA